MPKFDLLAVLTAALWVAFSVVQICFSAFPLAYTSTHSKAAERTFTFTTLSTNISYALYWLPLHTLSRSHALQAATGALGVITGSFVAFIVLKNKPFVFACTGRRAPRSFAWPTISAILSVLFFSLALASLVVSFYDEGRHGSGALRMSLCLAEHATSSTCSASSIVLRQSLTIESWVCGLSRSYSQYSTNLTEDTDIILPRTCRRTITARYMTIPLVVAPILVIAVGLLEKRRRNMDRYQNNHHKPGKEASFSSSEPGVVTTSPNGTLPAYPGHELYGSQKLSVEVPNKQVLEAPEAGHGNGVAEMSEETHRIYTELPSARSRERL